MRWLERLEEGADRLPHGGDDAVAFVQVVARYVFNYSFVWALELNGVLFALADLLGMSYGVRVGAHIGIDALVTAARAARRRASSAWSRAGARASSTR